MDYLRFRSLKGIEAVRRRSKQLTPLSSDVFISIPERDATPLPPPQGDKAPSISSLPHDIRHLVLTYLTS